MPTLSPEVWAALVAAGASILVSVVSLVASLRTARMQHRSALNTERLRHSFELRREERKRAAEGRNLELTALASQISAVQELRDYLGFLASAPSGTLLTEDATKRLTVLGERVGEVYRETMNSLPKEDTSLYHRLKNHVVTGVSVVISAVGSAERLKTNKRFIDTVLSLRAELGEIQNIIRDKRYERREDN
jgi:molybdopterin converting factor small subunit/heme exporter protein D